MDRAFRGVAVGLMAMFILLAWAILVVPAGLLVKLIMFFALTASAFGITLVMTTESPVADAVLTAPWADEEAVPPAAGSETEAGETPSQSGRPRRTRSAVRARGAGGERTRRRQPRPRPQGRPRAGRLRATEADLVYRKLSHGIGLVRCHQ